ncbi:Hypothetical protein PHPALM_8701 [Phytophthora palmivora]|uniref:Uncharacterized protein n=1 Tax=Phytophthora palmivora TaxID=4796 RepID=A0A2P4Y967_9STRA|nr:Hypothetical protein PHPALM_8701 [Phytophthora palmivora]
MERRERKRRANEIESPPVVSEKINELHSVWMESDTNLRKEISELRDEVGSLKKQLEGKIEECESFQNEATFLHPDAVIDRARVKLWHHGDLSVLRNVIDPRTRLTRNMTRSLFLAETTPKKGRNKPSISDGKAAEVSPKHECEETPPQPPATPDPTTSVGMDIEEKKQEEDELIAPIMPGFDAQAELSPEKKTNNDTGVELSPEKKINNDVESKLSPQNEATDDTQVELSPQSETTDNAQTEPLPENGSMNPMSMDYL